MKPWTLAIAAAGILALAFIAWQRAQGAAAESSEPTQFDPLPPWDSWPSPSSGDSSDFASDSPPADDDNTQLPGTLETIVNTTRDTFTPAPALPFDVQAANERAFLAMIRHSEGTDRAADPYRVTFGFGYTIQDLSDHPAVTGEWTGRSFTNLAGSTLKSTAAGAYQFLRATWIDLRDLLQLPDFGPDSQDRAALELVRQRGAANDVRAGRFADAVAKCAKTWASLPGAGYAQPERTIASLQDAYVAAGGTLET